VGKRYVRVAGFMTFRYSRRSRDTRSDRCDMLRSRFIRWLIAKRRSIELISGGECVQKDFNSYRPIERHVCKRCCSSPRGVGTQPNTHARVSISSIIKHARRVENVRIVPDLFVSPKIQTRIV